MGLYHAQIKSRMRSVIIICADIVLLSIFAYKMMAHAHILQVPAKSTTPDWLSENNIKYAYKKLNICALVRIYQGEICMSNPRMGNICLLISAHVIHMRA